MQLIRQAIKFFYYRFFYKNRIDISLFNHVDFKSTFGKACVLKTNSRVSASTIGDNLLLLDNAILKVVSTEDHVAVYKNTIVTYSEIGRYSYIANDSKINNATIGRFCSIGFEVHIGTGKHPIDFKSTSPVFYSTNRLFTNIPFAKEQHYSEYERCTIGNDVWIGARAIILDGVTIGNGAIIGANSLVTKDVEPYSIVGGVPAKHIKYRFSAEKIQALQAEAWWNWTDEKLTAELSSFQKPIS